MAISNAFINNNHRGRRRFGLRMVKVFSLNVPGTVPILLIPRRLSRYEILPNPMSGISNKGNVAQYMP
jgi:hypothetical protein